jgi:D-lactate dehydrogenase (cytochrome)
MERSLERLQALLGNGKVSTSPSVLEQHGRDENFPEVRPPLAVAYAESKEDVQTVLEWCRTWRIPLIPFGAGTSLEGALVPARPDALVLSLDLSRMNQVVSIQPDNFLAVVQPGIGLVKRRFMVEEHGASVAWMHRLKALFDPDGLLNPGKLI